MKHLRSRFMPSARGHIPCLRAGTLLTSDIRRLVLLRFILEGILQHSSCVWLFSSFVRHVHTTVYGCGSFSLYPQLCFKSYFHWSKVRLELNTKDPAEGAVWFPDHLSILMPKDIIQANCSGPLQKREIPLLMLSFIEIIILFSWGEDTQAASLLQGRKTIVPCSELRAFERKSGHSSSQKWPFQKS